MLSVICSVFGHQVIKSLLNAVREVAQFKVLINAGSVCINVYIVELDTGVNEQLLGLFGFLIENVEAILAAFLGSVVDDLLLLRGQGLPDVRGHDESGKAGDVLVVQRVDPFEKLRLYRAVGRRIPAYADAAGKILLAEKSDADVMRLYPEGLTAITPKTITNPSVLFESLDATRQTGVAVSNEESTMYVRSVAVPIKKHDVTCYGLEACFSIFDYTEEKERKILYELYELKGRIEGFLKMQ